MSDSVEPVRAWVTGGTGFAGTWLHAHLAQAGDEVVIAECDITDFAAVAAEIATVRPEAVYHLAGQANVGASWDDPFTTFQVNALGTLNVMQGIVKAGGTFPRVVVVGSAEVYGVVQPSDLPLTETRLTRPSSPYAASKVAAEAVAIQAFAGSGVPVCVARSFNHIGPGQSDGFVVSAIAKRVVEARRDGLSSIQVGNLSPRRDFTDVRDVVRAYRCIVANGVPGEVYNVCTGVSVSVADVAAAIVLADAAVLDCAPLEIDTDVSLQRPVDVPELRGDRSKITRDTGWEPALSVDDTVREVLAHWRRVLAG